MASVPTTRHNYTYLSRYMPSVTKSTDDDQQWCVDDMASHFLATTTTTTVKQHRNGMCPFVPDGWA